MFNGKWHYSQLEKQFNDININLYTKERNNTDVTDRLDKVTLQFERSAPAVKDLGEEAPGIDTGTNFQRQLGPHYRQQIAVPSEIS